MAAIRAIDRGDAGRSFRISYGNWNFGNFQDYTYEHTFTPTAIASVKAADGDADATIYTLNGKQVSAPQKGVNITRLGDGTTKKILVP